MPTGTSELDVAVTEFRTNYQQYAAKNGQFILIESDLRSGLQGVQVGGRLGETAQIFHNKISEFMRDIEIRRGVSKKKWVNKLGTFSSKLFPIASLSLNLAASVSQVTPI
jgi:hypothetical protein